MQCREFISVVNDFNRPPTTLAKTSDLIEWQGGMPTIDMTDYIWVCLKHHVGIN